MWNCTIEVGQSTGRLTRKYPVLVDVDLYCAPPKTGKKREDPMPLVISVSMLPPKSESPPALNVRPTSKWPEMAAAPYTSSAVVGVFPIPKPEVLSRIRSVWLTSKRIGWSPVDRIRTASSSARRSNFVVEALVVFSILQVG